MNLPRFSTHHPVFASMATLIVVILGGVSLSRLRIDLLPTVDLPTLSIQTEYTGASPEVMERLVTQVIEEIVSTVPGVEEVTSSSTEGRSSVTVRFAWGTNIDTAAMDLQATLENDMDELPDDISRPRVSKFDVNSFPVVILGVSSEMDPVQLTDLIENQLRFRFARVPGVAQIDIWGGFNREVRIELDPDRVNALGMSLDRVLQALRDANLDLPAGKIERGRFEVTLRAPSEFASIEDIRNTVIEQRDMAPVTIGQIADVTDGFEKLSRFIRINDQRGVRVAVRKQPEANTVDVAKGVLAEIEAVNRDFPKIKVLPVINQGNFIERSISNVTQSVLYGGGLSTLVLLFFLRNVRSTVVIALAIPISIIATFSLIYFGGYTINLMTLGGLALGVGMMVDSSVVVLENIFRRQDEDGEEPMVAAINGTNEVAGAIVASTLTTLVIFLPLAFVRGVSGILFQELALVVVFSLVCSLMVSLSLVPVLASRLLRSPQHQHDRRGPRMEKMAQVADRMFLSMDTQYRDILLGVLRHRMPVVIGSFLLLAASLLLLPYIGSEFLPPSDEGEVRVTGEMEVGTRLELVDEQSLKMEEVVFASVPELVSTSTTVGSNRGGANSARTEIRITLPPASQRDRSNTEVADDLRKRLDGKIPGMRVRTRAPQGQFLLERLLGGEEGITVEIRGFDLATLTSLCEQAAKKIEGVAGITDLTLSLESGQPQETLRIDREKTAALGFSVRDVTRFLETAMAGSRAGSYRVDGNAYDIRVQLKDPEKRNMDEILDLNLTTPDGQAVALRNLMDASPGIGPLVIERKDQQRLVKIQANVAGRDLGSVANEVKALLDTIPRPTGYDIFLAGKIEEQQKAFQELMVSLVLALVFVYMVLACQYESLVYPLVVMVSVPMAAIGVLVTLFLTETTLNLQSYIGCIMLGGIVVNNAILLVDQSSQLLRQGKTVAEAVSEAGRRRLRPILMTTLTTVLALVPLALGMGEGADAQAPLARAVVGGLSASTLITLVLVPVVFSLFHPEKKAVAA